MDDCLSTKMYSFMKIKTKKLPMPSYPIQAPIITQFHRNFDYCGITFIYGDQCSWVANFFSDSWELNFVGSVKVMISINI